LVPNVYWGPVLITSAPNAVYANGNTMFYSRNWVAGDEHAVSDVWVLLGCCDASSLGI